jgi:excisionase family DNA binding protein
MPASNSQNVERVALSPAEASSAPGVSVSVIYRMVKRGELRARHCGTRVLIPRRALDEYLQGEAS